MAYEKTVWHTGDLISAEKMNKIEDELEGLRQKQDSINADTFEETLTRVEKLEDLTAANVSEKELTTNDNFIIIPTDAAINMGVFDMKVDLPFRQEEKDGDISPNNPKQFLPYNSIDFLLYNGSANLLDKKAAFEGDTLFTFDATNRVTGTIGAFSEKRIKLPRGLAGQKIHFYCATLGNTPTRLVFYRRMSNLSYSNEGSLAGSFYSAPTAYTNINGYYTLPTLDGSYYNDIYMSILPAQGSSVNYSDTLTLTVFSAALQQSNGSGEPETTYINLSEPILAGQADFSTGIATNQNASTMAVYYLLNSADLNIESFVENTNGSNYVICTRPDGASENTRSSHYRYLNGSGEEFYFTPSDANAEHKFTIHDSRFTDEATAKQILGDRSNNINFAIVSSFLMPGINEKIVTSQINSNKIIMPSIPSAIAAKDGNLSSLKYYQSSNAIMEDLQNQINTNKPHVMMGANQLMDGSEGYVPAPKRSTQDYNKFLSGSGQWQAITIPTYDNATAHTASNPGFGLATNGKGLSIDNNNPGILNINTSLSDSSISTTTERAGDTYVDSDNKLKVKLPLASTSQYGLVKIADDSYSNLINDSSGLRVPYYTRSSIASEKHAGVINPPDYERGPDLFFTSGGTWIDLFANLAQPYDNIKNYKKGEFIQYGDKIYQLNADLAAGEMWDATEVCYGDILKAYGLTLNGSLTLGNTTITESQLQALLALLN